MHWEKLKIAQNSVYGRTEKPRSPGYYAASNPCGTVKCACYKQNCLLRSEESIHSERKSQINTRYRIISEANEASTGKTI